MQIYVIRHCQAVGQSKDAPLTDSGFLQAEALARFLGTAPIERVICSPFLRAKQSIEPYTTKYGVPVSVDPRLAERVLSSGSLEHWLDCLQDSFNDFELAFEGGESNSQAMARAVQVAEEQRATDSECIAMVTHGNLMTLLLRYFDEHFGFDEWAKLTNPDVYLVSIAGDHRVVERIWNDTTLC